MYIHIIRIMAEQGDSSSSAGQKLISKKLTRREFLIRTGTLGAMATVALGTGAVLQGANLLYRLDRLVTPKPLPKESTLLMAKLIDAETKSWELGGGTLVDPRTILTCAHLNADEQTAYVTGEKYFEKFANEEGVRGNIDKVVNHPTLDLAIVRLKEPVNDIRPAGLPEKEIRPGDGPLTAVLTRDLYRREEFVGRAELVDQDEEGKYMGPRAFIRTPNDLILFGDSGSGLYLEKENRLVGIVRGSSTKMIFGGRSGVSPFSYFTNITNPPVLEWIHSHLSKT